MSSPFTIVSTKDAPAAIGPYSQAVVHNGTVYCSGNIPFVPSTMTLVEGGIQAQTQQALDNMFAIVKASGSDKSHVLKTTVFLKDMNECVVGAQRGGSGSGGGRRGSRTYSKREGRLLCGKRSRAR